MTFRLRGSDRLAYDRWLGGRQIGAVIRAMIQTGDAAAASVPRRAKDPLKKTMTRYEAERLRLVANAISNLNQIARAINAAALSGRVDTETVTAALLQLAALETQIGGIGKLASTTETTDADDL